MPAPYVLITAAHNEEGFITRTLDAVTAQAHAPVRWVIASDGSTDRTDALVRDYCHRHDFIELVRVARRANEERFASKVYALQAACQRLAGLEYDFIGNVDADVTFAPGYFAALLDNFQRDPALGIAGGIILEQRNGHFAARATNSLRSVAHAAQLVRRTCFEEIGGYLPLRYGGEDWCAEISARLHQWRVQAFAELEVFHHRPTGGAERLLRHRFREGKADFSFGSDPLFELFKCLRRVAEKPALAGALARLAGFASGYLRREPSDVPLAVVHFLQAEQRERVRRVFIHPRSWLADG